MDFNIKDNCIRHLVYNIFAMILKESNGSSVSYEEAGMHSSFID